MDLKSKEGQKLKQTTKHYKRQFSNTKKIPCILLCYY